MKKLILLGFIALFTSSLSAQECNAILFLKEGNVLEYTSYDKKNKATSKATHETISRKEEGGRYTALIKIVSTDIKGKNSFNSEYEVHCQDGLFSIDMNRFFDSAQLAQYDAEDFNIGIDGNILEFPSNMSAGDALNDGSITIKVNKDNFTVITMVMDVINRQVHENETITTDAGAFDCQKVTFDFETKMGIIKIRGSGIEWYNKDRVIVRSESYSKKGKLVASSDLTSIKE